MSPSVDPRMESSTESGTPAPTEEDQDGEDKVRTSASNAKAKLAFKAKSIFQAVKAARIFQSGGDGEQSGGGEEQSGDGQEHTRGIHAAEWKNVIELYCECYGRTYYFRCENDVQCEQWVIAINEAMKEAEEEYRKSLNLSHSERMRVAARNLYDSNRTQMFIALLLLSNFVISIIQCEMSVTDDERTQRNFDILEVCFTFVYLGELMLNMYGHFFWPFFTSGWCWFDLIVVMVSVVDAGYVLTDPGGNNDNNMSVLRLLRVFRIVRIFNKLEDMKRILNANLTAMSPVMNAFLLFAVIISIYAVMAVNMFEEFNNRENFRSFSTSFYTLLGVATGENWTTFINSLTRVEGEIDWQVVLYFVSFIFLVGIVAINIIVAVLLEGFMSSMSRHDATKRIADEAREHHRCSGALDPLLATLANFTSPQHFKSQLDLLFTLFDVDDNGTLDFNEMKNGIERLGYDPVILMSHEDWDAFTLQGLLENEDGEVDHGSFELAMRFQLAEYSQRLLANKMLQAIRGENEFAPILFAMKMAIMEIMAAAAERRQQSLALFLDKKEVQPGPSPQSPAQVSHRQVAIEVLPEHGAVGRYLSAEEHDEDEMSRTGETAGPEELQPTMQMEVLCVNLFMEKGEGDVTGGQGGQSSVKQSHTDMQLHTCSSTSLARTRLHALIHIQTFACTQSQAAHIRHNLDKKITQGANNDTSQRGFRVRA